MPCRKCSFPSTLRHKSGYGLTDTHGTSHRTGRRTAEKLPLCAGVARRGSRIGRRASLDYDVDELDHAPSGNSSMDQWRGRCGHFFRDQRVCNGYFAPGTGGKAEQGTRFPFEAIHPNCSLYSAAIALAIAEIKRRPASALNLALTPWRIIASFLFIPSKNGMGKMFRL